MMADTLALARVAAAAFAVTSFDGTGSNTTSCEYPLFSQVSLTSGFPPW